MKMICDNIINEFIHLKCCVFWPAFGSCKHPKAGQKTVLGLFSTFFVDFRCFQWFFSPKQEKSLNYQCLKLLFEAVRYSTLKNVCAILIRIFFLNLNVVRLFEIYKTNFNDTYAWRTVYSFLTILMGGGAPPNWAK